MKPKEAVKILTKIMKRLPAEVEELPELNYELQQVWTCLYDITSDIEMWLDERDQWGNTKSKLTQIIFKSR